MLAAAIIVIAILITFFTMSWWMPREWYRSLLYPGGRPNALSTWLNSGSAKLSALGIGPSFMVALETKGWRTGTTSRVPLVVAEVDGQQYLVSMLGENVNWVRNVRASGGQAVIIHGTAQPIRLVEVAVSDRAPILEAYLCRAPGFALISISASAHQGRSSRASLRAIRYFASLPPERRRDSRMENVPSIAGIEPALIQSAAEAWNP